ncbi:MAG: serine hydrolase domain-containing protein, partial [Planctomycetota bacterium]
MLLRRVFWVAILLPLPSFVLANDTPDYSAAIEQLTSVIRQEVEQKRLPAFSISIIDGDRKVWSDGFGFQDSDKSVPATAETVYRVGSVSKLFTDIA